MMPFAEFFDFGASPTIAKQMPPSSIPNTVDHLRTDFELARVDPTQQTLTQE
jgi:hypothetical protein